MSDTGRMRPCATILTQVGALLGAAVLCALISNALAGGSRRLPWTGRPAATDLPPPAPDPPVPIDLKGRYAADPSQPIRDVSTEEAWGLFQARVPFLDARRSEDYAAGHVERAWRMPVWESDVDARITEFEVSAHPASTDPLVLYCSGGDCEDSHILASKLIGLGYRNLLIYREGYPDWVKQKRPVIKGDRP